MTKNVELKTLEQILKEYPSHYTLGNVITPYLEKILGTRVTIRQAHDEDDSWFISQGDIRC